jgi:hypothetical protein
MSSAPVKKDTKPTVLIISNYFFSATFFIHFDVVKSGKNLVKFCRKFGQTSSSAIGDNTRMIIWEPGCLSALLQESAERFALLASGYF